MSYDAFIRRRAELCRRLKEEHNDGVVILFADFEIERYRFRQDSSFYYFTGVTEPGAIVLLNLDGTSVLYLPPFGAVREQWVNVQARLSSDDGGASARELGFTSVDALGEQPRGYSLGPEFSVEEYRLLLDDIQDHVNNGSFIGAIIDGTSLCAKSARQRLSYLVDEIPGLQSAVKDVAATVHDMRRTKDDEELKLL